MNSIETIEAEDVTINRAELEFDLSEPNYLKSFQLSHKKLRNRIVVPPMASQTSDLTGLPTEKTISHYARLAKSGAALVFIEYSFVSEDGRSEPNQLGLVHSDTLMMLRKIVQRVHEAGALAGLQITHAGGKSRAAVTGAPLFTPSGLPVPGLKGEGEPSLPASIEEIHRVQEAFVRAAGTAQLAGIDVLEFHCAHGYGLNQWLSPLTNKRTDAYGGNQSSRSRILLEIVQRVSLSFPHLILSARFPGQDFIEGGLTQRDMVCVASDLAEVGLKLLNVSSGLGGWNRPGSRSGEGYLLDEARYLAVNQNLPVIAVGGFQSAFGIQKACETVPLVAVGRKILEAPEAFCTELGL